MKKYSTQNVYSASINRITLMFSEFNKVVISFSGGKDSGVMLNLVLEVANKLNRLQDVSVYHVDYEAQYQFTTDYVTRVFNALPEGVSKYWVCLPIKAQCSTSMFQSYWQPWLLSDKHKWCRNLPQNAITEENNPFDFDYEISDYNFNLKFAKWISKDESTCFMIGIRTQESLHRYKAVTKQTDKNEFKSLNYTTVINSNCVNAYPIYDWTVDDIWLANGRFNYDYNKLYDLMYFAGIKPNKMRVASPFNDAASESLKWYKALDPNNWGKLIGRVNGVNFTGLYGGTTAMGWNSITKPGHFTWKEYMYFLLDTLPYEVKENYLRKLKVSFAYWLEKGGALPVDVVEGLDKSLGFENLGEPNSKRVYSSEYNVIKFKEYLDEIDIKKPNLLPTYKRMCIAIMKNDTSCKTLGFGQTRDELERRTNTIKKYKALL